MKTKFSLFIYGALLKGQMGAVHMPWDKLISEEDFLIKGVTVAYFENPSHDISKSEPRFWPGILKLTGPSTVKGKLLTFQFELEDEMNIALRRIDEYEIERETKPDCCLTDRVWVERQGRQFDLYLVRTKHLSKIGARLLKRWISRKIFFWPDIISSQLK